MTHRSSVNYSPRCATDCTGSPPESTTTKRESSGAVTNTAMPPLQPYHDPVAKAARISTEAELTGDGQGNVMEVELLLSASTTASDRSAGGTDVADLFGTDHGGGDATPTNVVVPSHMRRQSSSSSLQNYRETFPDDSMISNHPLHQVNTGKLGGGSNRSAGHCNGGKRAVPLLPLAGLPHSGHATSGTVGPKHVSKLQPRADRGTRAHDIGAGWKCQSRESSNHNVYPTMPSLLVRLASATTPEIFSTERLLDVVPNAKLVLSLLPMGSLLTEELNDRDVDAALTTVLQALASMDTLSWVREYTATGSTTCESRVPHVPVGQARTQERRWDNAVDLVDPSSRLDKKKVPGCFTEPLLKHRAVDADDRVEIISDTGDLLSQQELDGVSITLLLRCTRGCIASGRHRCRWLPAGVSSSCHSQRFGRDVRIPEGQLGSCRHRDWVSAISRLALERTWLTRVLLRRVSTGFCLDDYLRSSSSFLPATTFLRIATFSRECIDMFLFDSCRSSHKLDFHEPSGTENEYCRARNECTGMIQRNHGLKVKPGSPLLAAPSIVNLVALMTGIVRFSMAWGEDLAWAASTCRAMALPDSAGNVGIIGVLVELLDALMTMLTVDNKCDRATAEEVVPPAEQGEEATVNVGGRNKSSCQRSHRRAATAAMPTGTRALAENIYGGVAELEELTCQLLHSMQAVLRRSAILLSTSRTGTCVSVINGVGSSTRNSENNPTFSVDGNSKTAKEGGTDQSACEQKIQRLKDALTTVVPEKERVPIAVVQETVSQVLRAVSPLFEPGGCVSALLDSQILPEAFTDESCSHGSSPFWQDKKTSRCTTKEKTGIAPVVLVGTLHLATIFFSLCSECRYDCGFLRLEGFASRLFLGFSTYLGNRAGSVDPESKHINPKVMKYFRWECRRAGRLPGGVS